MQFLRLMKRFVFCAAIGLLASGCPNAKENMDASNSTSTVATSGTETTGTTSTTSTGSSGGTISSLNAEDKDFFVKAALGGMAEVSLGQLAAGKATSGEVKNFANHMVNDHGKANDELKDLAMTKGLALPADLPNEVKTISSELSRRVGRDFDSAYMSDMIQDHEKDVSEFEKAARELKDPDLKAWATKTLPTLQDHLRMAKETAAKLK
jgi:putative membrane protein